MGPRVSPRKIVSPVVGGHLISVRESAHRVVVPYKLGVISKSVLQIIRIGIGQIADVRGPISVRGIVRSKFTLGSSTQHSVHPRIECVVGGVVGIGVKFEGNLLSNNLSGKSVLKCLVSIGSVTIYNNTAH